MKEKNSSKQNSFHVSRVSSGLDWQWYPVWQGEHLYWHANAPSAALISPCSEVVLYFTYSGFNIKKKKKLLKPFIVSSQKVTNFTFVTFTAI